MDRVILQFLRRADRRAALIIAGHPRLSRPARRRARRHLRRPLARADRLARRDAIAVHRSPALGERSARSGRLLDEPRVHAHRRADLLDGQGAARRRFPQEAIIGISYAVASAAVILAMSKATGRERAPASDMLVGNILSVQWPEVWTTARRSTSSSASSTTSSGSGFSQISVDPEGRRRAGVPVRLWDFLFYASFGLRRHAIGRDCRRAARVLLPDRAVGRRRCCGRIGSGRGSRSAG